MKKIAEIYGAVSTLVANVILLIALVKGTKELYKGLVDFIVDLMFHLRRWIKMGVFHHTPEEPDKEWWEKIELRGWDEL